MAMYFRASDGTRIAYYVDEFTDPWKDAETIVMVHSAMGRAERWYAMVPWLARHFRVVRLDMRGFGLSASPPWDKPLTMERLVEDVVELMDHVGSETAHVLGQAAGGFVAQNLAFSFPARVRSLLLYASVPGLKRTTATSWVSQIGAKGLRRFLEETIRFRFDPETTDPGQIKWYLDEASKNDVAHLARFVDLMSSLDWSDRLHEIVCPTLLVIPGQDVTDGTRDYSAFERSMRNLTTVVHEGAPHQITDFAPDRCAREALDFLGARPCG